MSHETSATITDCGSKIYWKPWENQWRNLIGEKDVLLRGHSHAWAWWIIRASKWEARKNRRNNQQVGTLNPDIAWIAVARPRRWACHRATAGGWIRGVPERYAAGADTRGRQEGRPYPWSQ